MGAQPVRQRARLLAVAACALAVWQVTDASSIEDTMAKFSGMASAVGALQGELHVAPNHEKAAHCQMSGKIVDCGCDFASVESMNHYYLFPLLGQLTRQPFYRFFKVNLYCDCQFWPGSGMCSRRDCAVSECGPGDIPPQWLTADRALEEARLNQSIRAAAKANRASIDTESQDSEQDSHSDTHTHSDGHTHSEGGDQHESDESHSQVDTQHGGAGGEHEAEPVTGQVDRSVDDGVENTLTAVVDWRALNNPWLPDDDNTGSIEYSYVDLSRNEEKYTGYKGEDARRIWAAIYDQSVLKEAAQQAQNGHTAEVPVPREQQVLYRLISGMHTSITTSIIKNYYNEETGTWGPNMPFFKARFVTPSAQPHIENLYFTLLFVLRATTKAGSALLKLDYHSGWHPEEAEHTQQMVTELLTSPELQTACPVPFDEGLLWTQDPQHHDTLRQQLQVAFHNITRLMDCVGCEKCKLNGKLNMLGIASALKVLFAQPQIDSEGALTLGTSSDDLVLERNEAIALVNFLAKLSDSVETIRELSIRVREEMEAAQEEQARQLEAQAQAESDTETQSDAADTDTQSDTDAADSGTDSKTDSEAHVESDTDSADTDSEVMSESAEL